MTRSELDRMLEKAVAEAIGVTPVIRPTKRRQRLRTVASRRASAQHGGRELQHA